ncbi:MAG TPA: hypothetical protein DIT55_05680 [Spirochaetaceae bacterium]|nr:hypothetical protein [Spirochaetaceae bacterium]
MKKRSVYIVVALIASLAFAGCNLLSQESAIIGTWEETILGVTTTYVFNGDGSAVETTSISGVGVSTNGNWNSDSTTLTILWDGASESEVSNYSFNGDATTMTLSPPEGGLSRTFVRQ